MVAAKIVSIEVETVLVGDDLGLNRLSHLRCQCRARLLTHLQQLLELRHVYLVAVQVYVGQLLSFLQIDCDKLAVLTLFLLIDEIEHGH